VLDETTRGLLPLGRREGDDEEGGPTAHVGVHRAPDGSDGAPLRVDVDGPHAALVVGKRGYGKSYTLGVLAEELARTDGVAPVVVDTMGVFGGLTATAAGDPVPAERARPSVPAGDLPPRAWCSVLGLDPTDAVGTLVWRAAERAETLPSMRAFVDDAAAERATRRAAENHLSLAADWGVFGGDGLGLLDGPVSVLDVAGLDRAPANVVVRAVAERLYDARVEEEGPLPWLLVDEAHVFFDGVAASGLRTLLTRGRGPGVSLVVATQRPSALPAVALSQADLLVAHRLTAEADRDALDAARPTYVDAALSARLPHGTGAALVVDDVTEAAYQVRVRERRTPHGGGTPRASDGSAAHGVDPSK